jgi:hypothetical protein
VGPDVAGDRCTADRSGKAYLKAQHHVIGGPESLTRIARLLRSSGKLGLIAAMARYDD